MFFVCPPSIFEVYKSLKTCGILNLKIFKIYKILKVISEIFDFQDPEDLAFLPRQEKILRIFKIEPTHPGMKSHLCT